MYIHISKTENGSLWFVRLFTNVETNGRYPFANGLNDLTDLPTYS